MYLAYFINFLAFCLFIEDFVGFNIFIARFYDIFIIFFIILPFLSFISSLLLSIINLPKFRYLVQLPDLYLSWKSCQYQRFENDSPESKKPDSCIPIFRTMTLLGKHRKLAQAAMEVVQAVGTGLQAYLITARFTFTFYISIFLK